MSSETVIYDGYGDVPLKSDDRVVIMNSIPRKTAYPVSKEKVTQKGHCPVKREEKEIYLGLPEEEEQVLPQMKQNSKQKSLQCHPSWYNPYVRGSVGKEQEVARVLRQSESFIQAHVEKEPKEHKIMSKAVSQPDIQIRQRLYASNNTNTHAKNAHVQLYTSKHIKQQTELSQQVPDMYNLKKVQDHILPKDSCVLGPTQVVGVRMNGVYVNKETLKESKSMGKLQAQLPKKSRKSMKKVDKMEVSRNIPPVLLPPILPHSKKLSTSASVSMLDTNQHNSNNNQHKSLYTHPPPLLNTSMLHEIPYTSQYAIPPKSPPQQQALHTPKTSQQASLQQQRSSLALLKMSDSRQNLHSHSNLLNSNLLLSVSTQYDEQQPKSSPSNQMSNINTRISVLPGYITKETCSDAFFLYQYMQQLNNIQERPRSILISQASIDTIPSEPTYLLTNAHILQALQLIQADVTAIDMQVSQNRLQDPVSFHSFVSLYHEYNVSIQSNEKFAGMNLCGLAMTHKRQSSLQNTMMSNNNNTKFKILHNTTTLKPAMARNSTSLFEDVELYENDLDYQAAALEALTVRRIDTENEQVYTHIRKLRDKEQQERQRLLTEQKGEVLQSPAHHNNHINTSKNNKKSFWGQNNHTPMTPSSGIGSLQTNTAIIHEEEEEEESCTKDNTNNMSNNTNDTIKKTSIYAENQDVRKKAQYSIKDTSFPLSWMPQMLLIEFLKTVNLLDEEQHSDTKKSIIDTQYHEDGNVKSSVSYASLENIWKLIGNNQHKQNNKDKDNNNHTDDTTNTTTTTSIHTTPTRKKKNGNAIISTNTTPTLQILEVRKDKFISPLPNDGISVAPVWKRLRPVDKNVEFTLLHSKEGGAKILESVRLPPQARLAFSVSQEEALLQYYQLQLQYSLKNRPDGESVLATPLIVATKPNLNSLIGAPEELTKLVLSQTGGTSSIVSTEAQWEEELHQKQQQLDALLLQSEQGTLQLHELAFKKRLEREIDELLRKKEGNTSFSQKTAGQLLSQDSLLVDDETSHTSINSNSGADEENTIHELAVKSQSAQVLWVIYHLRQMIIQLAPEGYAPPSILSMQYPDQHAALLLALRKARVHNLYSEPVIHHIVGNNEDNILEQDTVDLQLQMDYKEKIRELLDQYKLSRNTENHEPLGKFLMLNEEVDEQVMGQVKTILRSQNIGASMSTEAQNPQNYHNFSLLQQKRQTDDETEQQTLDLKHDHPNIDEDSHDTVVHIVPNHVSFSNNTGIHKELAELPELPELDALSSALTPVLSTSSTPITPMKTSFMAPPDQTIPEEASRAELLSPFEFGGSFGVSSVQPHVHLQNNSTTPTTLKKHRKQPLFVDIGTPANGTVRRLPDYSSRASSRASSRNSNRSRSSSRAPSSRPSSPRAILSSTRNLKQLFSQPTTTPSAPPNLSARRGSFGSIMTPTMQYSFSSMTNMPTSSSNAMSQSSKTPLVLYTSTSNYKQGHLNVQKLKQQKELNPSASIVGLVEQSTYNEADANSQDAGVVEDANAEVQVSILDLAKQTFTLKNSRELDPTGLCVLALVQALECLLGVSEQRDQNFRERILKVSLQSVKDALEKAKTYTMQDGALTAYIPTLERIVYVLESIVAVTQTSQKHLAMMRTNKRDELLHAGLKWYGERKRMLKDVLLLLQDQSQAMNAMLEIDMTNSANLDLRPITDNSTSVNLDDDVMLVNPVLLVSPQNSKDMQDSRESPEEETPKPQPKIVPTKISQSGLLMLPDLDAIFAQNMPKNK